MFNLTKLLTKKTRKTENHDILTEVNAIADDQESMVCCDICNGMTLVKFTEKRTRVNYVDSKEGRVDVYVCKTHIPYLEKGETIGGDC